VLNELIVNTSTYELIMIRTEKKFADGNKGMESTQNVGLRIRQATKN